MKKNNVTYLKKAYKHEQVAEVKKQVLKAYKLIKDIEHDFDICKLTGLISNDSIEISRIIKKAYIQLKDGIDLVTEDESYDETEYNFDYDILVLRFLKEMQKALVLVEEYPAIEFKKTEYIFHPEDSAPKRHRDLYQFTENLKSKIRGFNAAFYIVLNNNNRMKLDLTNYNCYDLLNGDKIEIEYQ